MSRFNPIKLTQTAAEPIDIEKPVDMVLADEVHPAEDCPDPITDDLARRWELASYPFEPPSYSDMIWMQVPAHNRVYLPPQSVVDLVSRKGANLAEYYQVNHPTMSTHGKGITLTQAIAKVEYGKLFPTGFPVAYDVNNIRVNFVRRELREILEDDPEQIKLEQKEYEELLAKENKAEHAKLMALAQDFANQVRTARQAGQHVTWMKGPHIAAVKKPKQQLYLPPPPPDCDGSSSSFEEEDAPSSEQASSIQFKKQRVIKPTKKSQQSLITAAINAKRISDGPRVFTDLVDDDSDGYETLVEEEPEPTPPASEGEGERPIPSAPSVDEVDLFIRLRLAGIRTVLQLGIADPWLENEEPFANQVIPLTESASLLTGAAIEVEDARRANEVPFAHRVLESDSPSPSFLVENPQPRVAAETSWLHSPSPTRNAFPQPGLAPVVVSVSPSPLQLAIAPRSPIQRPSHSLEAQLRAASAGQTPRLSAEGPETRVLRLRTARQEREGVTMSWDGGRREAMSEDGGKAKVSRFQKMKASFGLFRRSVQ